LFPPKVVNDVRHGVEHLLGMGLFIVTYVSNAASQARVNA
jgi:hypothetical protein